MIVSFVAKIAKNISKGYKNNVGKKEDAGYQHFLIFLQFFFKYCLSSAS